MTVVYPYDMATAIEGLKLGGSRLIVSLDSNEYTSISTNNLVYDILEEPEGYTVVNSHQSKSPIVVAKGDNIYYQVNNEDAYTVAEWASQTILGLNKEQELLKAFKWAILSLASFGGPSPYITPNPTIYLETTMYEKIALDDYIHRVSQKSLSEDIYYVIGTEEDEHSDIIKKIAEIED